MDWDKKITLRDIVNFVKSKIPKHKKVEKIEVIKDLPLRFQGNPVSYIAANYGYTPPAIITNNRYTMATTSALMGDIHIGGRRFTANNFSSSCSTMWGTFPTRMIYSEVKKPCLLSKEIV